MIYKIVCPVQDPATFDINQCFRCKYFEMSIGKQTTHHCRKNRSPQHKRDFEGAILSNLLNIPDQVVVEGTEETNK